MPKARDVPAGEPIVGVLLDLLMAVMDSLGVWPAAAGDRRRGLAWRDAVTARMIAAPLYVPYEDLVRTVAVDLGLPNAAVSVLFERWPAMTPWPDAAVLSRLIVRYAFVTNCSTELASWRACGWVLRQDARCSSPELHTTRSGRGRPASR